MFELFYVLLLSLNFNEVISSFLATLSATFILFAITYSAHFLVKYTLRNKIRERLKNLNFRFSQIFDQYDLVPTVLHFFVPGLFYILLPIAFDGEISQRVKFILNALERGCGIYFIILIGVLINDILNILEGIYNSYPVSKKWPLRTYIQFSKIFFFLLIGVVIIAYAMEKSPMALLTGLGAVVAVVGFVFKDSILSFVSSIQLASSDMIRVGDWIEIPGQNISGDVEEISLNTIKIRNFDKTISTIPPYYVVGNSVKNWRGMFEAGGRRIKRSFLIDIHTIKAATPELLNKLENYMLLKPFIYSEKERLLKTGTNLELFRAYTSAFLIDHPKIHSSGFLSMCRLLESQENGQPLEVYAYTTDTSWTKHEDIQAQIFEHLIATLQDFDLKPYQGE